MNNVLESHSIPGFKKMIREINQYHKKNRFIIKEVKDIKKKNINKDEIINKIKVHKELIHKLKIEEQTLIEEEEEEVVKPNFILFFD